MSYNRVAGQNLHRLEALSDGVFAFAMTVLVLDLRVPAASAIHSDAALGQALAALAPSLLTYLMSFTTLSIFWIGQQTQHNFLARSDRAHAWLNMAFLAAVTLVPFSTALLAAFIASRLALLVYWANIFALGMTLLATWYRARWFGLVREDAPEGTHAAIVRRIAVAQTLYACAAALCLIGNWWSLAAMVAIQLQYAIAPRFWPLDRI